MNENEIEINIKTQQLRTMVEFFIIIIFFYCVK